MADPTLPDHSARVLCSGSYETPRDVTERDPTGLARRARCPSCGKDVAVNRETGIRAHSRASDETRREEGNDA